MQGEGTFIIIEARLKLRKNKFSPAYDLATCQKNGFVPVDWDGENDAKAQPYDVNGNLHIVHINDHDCSDDLNYDELMGYYKEWVAGLGIDWDELRNKGEAIRQSPLFQRPIYLKKNTYMEKPCRSALYT